MSLVKGITILFKILPNKIKMNLAGCIVIANTWGNLASERIEGENVETDRVEREKTEAKILDAIYSTIEGVLKNVLKNVFKERSSNFENCSSPFPRPSILGTHP